MSQAEKITDHASIRSWAEERGGRPAMVEGTSQDGMGVGVLRFDFGGDDEDLREIDWDTFFDTFERKKLALLAEPASDGETSRFFKFIAR